MPPGNSHAERRLAAVAVDLELRDPRDRLGVEEQQRADHAVARVQLVVGQ
jgi:hypothetical protein